MVKKYRRKGLVLLLIFKTIKKEVKEELENENPEIDWNEYENDINNECIKLAKEIVNRNKENHTKKEIRKAIDSIKKSV